MSTPLILMLVVIATPVVGWLALSCLSYLIMSAVGKAELEQLGIDELENAVRTALSQGLVAPEWLTVNSFEPAGAFHIVSTLNPTMVVWKLRRENTFLCIYLVPSGPTMIEFHSILEGGGLSTGSTRDSVLLPPWPGHWSQAFKSVSTTELYKRHRDALEYLRQELGERLDHRPVDVRTAYLGEIHESAAYVRELPFWALRMPYWFLFLRGRRFNKSVREQHEKLNLGSASRERATLQWMR